MATPKADHPARYRASQFFVAVKAYLPVWAGGMKGKLAATDDQLITSILPTLAQRQLFDRMSLNDQRHALAVLRTLQEANHNHPALMRASLLHDVGKSMGQPIIHRVLIVLFIAFWPAALRCLSLSSPDSSKISIQSVAWWRRPFVIHAQHPAIGASWASEANCDPLTVSLIAKHQDQAEEILTEEQKLLAALQWADDLN